MIVGNGGNILLSGIYGHGRKIGSPEEEEAEAALDRSVTPPFGSKLNTLGTTPPTIQHCSLIGKEKSSSSELTDDPRRFQKPMLVINHADRKPDQNDKVRLVSFFLTPRCSIA